MAKKVFSPVIMLIYVAFDIENNSKLPGDKYHM
jgi:hypothetical protein